MNLPTEIGMTDISMQIDTEKDAVKFSTALQRAHISNMLTIYPDIGYYVVEVPSGYKDDHLFQKTLKRYAKSIVPTDGA